MDENKIINNLKNQKSKISKNYLSEVFKKDGEARSKYSINFENIFVDYSKHLVDDAILQELFNLAEIKQISEKRKDIFTGKKINNTENRSVLHPALRAKISDEIFPKKDLINVHETLDQMKEFTTKIHSGAWSGYSGKKINTIINIGIGGSDLGPAMITTALEDFTKKDIKSYFVSNIDPSDLKHALDNSNPETTLVVVVSKTFTTIETITNATKAKEWFLRESGQGIEAVAKHFVAVSTNTEKVKEFGIGQQQMFEFWDWVGGRYSTDSAVGLSIMLAIGIDNFQQMLNGFRAMDNHFLNTEITKNIPVILALIEFWYNNFFNFSTRVILPYSFHMRLLPAYLQQLMMESNGKSVTKDGEKSTYETGEIIWGAAGTNGQHAFYQLLHQGTFESYADFIGVVKNPDNLDIEDMNTTQQDLLFSNLLAQSKVLAFGKDTKQLLDEGISEEIAPHKVMPGNRPSTTILMNELNPYNLGSLIAIYEHQVYVYGLLVEINSFDQWGVELGKQEAISLLDDLISDNDPAQNLDSSTKSLIAWYKSKK